MFAVFSQVICRTCGGSPGPGKGKDSRVGLGEGEEEQTAFRASGASE